MEKLSDFKPLERVTLPEVGELRCAGLVLVVGPNSSGKTQFLQDLFRRLIGEPRTLVVASDVRVSKPDYEPFIRCLESEGYFQRSYDNDGNLQWRPLTTYLGTGQAINQIQPNQGQQWHQQYQPAQEKTVRRSSEFLNYFGRLLVTALFLERRLTSLNQVAVIDFQEQPPQQELHALYLDDDARKQLFDEIFESFGNAVWPDTSRGNVLCIRVSDEGVLPTAEDRLSPKKMAAYRTIETEGDGLKSYVATCVALLLGRRPVCIIDEPEMCLHPTQAYNLGRFIGRHGASAETATFVATHSSEVLRGVIQSGENIQIVRLSRREGEFVAHLVPAEVLAEAVAKPTVRAESVLDGIFAQSVVVVEGYGDRLVYQTVWETLAAELRLDVHFAAVGGTGGISDTCKLCRTLNIPIAVVSDLDLISDPARLQRVVEEMGGAELAEALCSKARSIMEDIGRLPPTISSEEVVRSLRPLIEMRPSWEDDGDIPLQRELSRLARALDRMRKLKRGGVTAFPSNIAEPLRALLTELERIGIFLVPVGELEEWLQGEEIGESKRKKWAWANAAALRIQAKGSCIGDIWDFVRVVGSYLASR